MFHVIFVRAKVLFFLTIIGLLTTSSVLKIQIPSVVALTIIGDWAIDPISAFLSLLLTLILIRWVLTTVDRSINLAHTSIDRVVINIIWAKWVTTHFFFTHVILLIVPVVLAHKLHLASFHALTECSISGTRSKRWLGSIRIILSKSCCEDKGKNYSLFDQ